MLEHNVWGDLAAELQRIKLSYEKSFFYQGDPDTSLAHARKSAEAICKQIYKQENLEKGGKPVNKLMLDGLIHILNQKECIPPYIAINLKTIQAFGNFGSHDQGKDIHYATPENINPCLQILTTVMCWYFYKYHKNKIYFKPIELTGESREQGLQGAYGIQGVYGTQDVHSTQGVYGTQSVHEPQVVPKTAGFMNSVQTRVAKTLFFVIFVSMVLVGSFFAIILLQPDDVRETEVNQQLPIESDKPRHFVIDPNNNAIRTTSLDDAITADTNPQHQIRGRAALIPDTATTDASLDDATTVDTTSSQHQIRGRAALIPDTATTDTNPQHQIRERAAITPDTDAKNSCVEKNKIHAAAMTGDFSFVETCLKAGINVNVREDSNGWTLLHAAAFSGDRTIVELLLNSGASVNALDQQQRSPLSYAVEEKKDIIVSILEQHEGR